MPVIKGSKQDLWEHYPANDLIPEHYSCPFGLVILTSDNEWEVWVTSALYIKINNPGDIVLSHCLGKRKHINHAKAMINFLIKNTEKSRAVAA